MKKTFLLVALLSSVVSVRAMEQEPLDAYPPKLYKAPLLEEANPFTLLGEEKQPRGDSEVGVEAELKWIEKMEAEVKETDAEIARLRKEVCKGDIRAARDAMVKLKILMEDSSH